MITWNYRVFREADGDHVIREVFYDEQDLIIACTAEAVEPMGHTLTELADDLRAFQAALELPVLTLDNVPTNATVSRQRDRHQNQRLDDLLHMWPQETYQEHQV